MALYEELARINILGAIKGRFKMNTDGRIPITLTMDLNQVWINNGRDPNRECILWLWTFFKYYSVLPSHCLCCWKTYCAPESLRELMEIHKFQQEDSRTFADISCKCGIEIRPFSGGLGQYRAFWYNPLSGGLAQARKNTHTLSEALGRKLFLKRGCTEMEQFTRAAFNKGSDSWEDVVNAGMKFKQELLESTFFIDGEMPNKLPKALEVDILQRWIEFAAEHGDQTYLDFVDKPFFPKLTQYIGSIHNPKDFPGGDYGKHNNESEQGRTEESPRVETLEKV